MKRPSSSVVVVDLKPELAELTAMDLADKGFEIVLLDPHHRMKGILPFESHKLNFLDFTDRYEEFLAFGNEMVIRDKNGGGATPHFEEMAVKCISSTAALCRHVGVGPERTLNGVAHLCGSPEKLLQARGMMIAAGGYLEQLGNGLKFLDGEEKNGVGTTISRKIQWLLSPEMAQNVMETTFDLQRMRSGGMAVFIIPGLPQYVELVKPWLRVCIGTIIRTVMKQPLGEKNKIHMIFDEAPLLGHLDVIDQLLNVGAGWGFRGQWYWQNKAQIKQCFPDQEETFLSNVTSVFFCVNDVGQHQGTANYIVQRAGKETILVNSTNSGTSESRSNNISERGEASVNYSTSTNEGISTSQQGRELWTVDEVLTSHPREAYTFIPGKHPLKTWLIRWYEESNLFQGMGELPILIRSVAFLVAVCIGTLFAAKAAFMIQAYRNPIYVTPVKGEDNETGAIPVSETGDDRNRSGIGSP
jgi:type IV secretory pathway TraG/TraD family ATPase VirD4